MDIRILVFIIGAMVGSVINAIVYRLPRNISWKTGRSQCPKCRHELGWTDLIPLFSYIFLRGKCRYCKKRFGIRYFLVEILMAVGFTLIYNFQFSLFDELSIVKTIILMGILAVTVVIAVMDWETQLIADVTVLVWVGLVVSYKLLVVGSFNDWTNTILAVVVGVAIIGGIWLLSRKNAMGEGDVGLAVVMGMWLGWPNILVALWIAFVAGGLVGLGVVLAKKGGMKSKIAFGPFLVIGSWVAFVFGDILFKLTGL